MTGPLRAWRQNLLAGFWLLPGLVAAAFAGLAFGVLAIDRAAGPRGVAFGFDGDAGAARDILATIAGSLITVAGLTFSLTIVVLTLISSQFTPRALRGFLADRLTQVVAGVFVGIFVYCLLVLRRVRDEGAGDPFVPGLSVTVAIGLGLLTLAFLLAFIHHMGQTIQASHIAARVASTTNAAIDRVYPERYDPSREQSQTGILDSWLEDGEPARVTPARSGHVQLIDVAALVDHAPAGARLHVAVRPGEFVTESDTLVRIWPADALEAVRTTARRAITIQNERDLREDPAFGLRQLTDIALKALSPGITRPNDGRHVHRLPASGARASRRPRAPAIPAPVAVGRGRSGRGTQLRGGGRERLRRDRPLCER